MHGNEWQLAFYHTPEEVLDLTFRSCASKGEIAVNLFPIVFKKGMAFAVRCLMAKKGRKNRHSQSLSV